MQLRGLVIKAI